jgi:hemerythrin-like domain-containing protein
MEPELIKLRKKDDPIRRNVDKGIEDDGTSPMAPPDAYSPPGHNQGVPYEEMHPALQALRDEHTAFVDDLTEFEEALATIRENGPNREVDLVFSSFFRAVDEKVVPHNRQEERGLFPILAQRLIDHGEHSKGPEPHTAIDVLMDDHLQIVQLSAVIFNFFAVASRIPDDQSRGVILKAAVEQGQILAELLRLHMFREDHVLFSLAQKYLSTEELDSI